MHKYTATLVISFLLLLLSSCQSEQFERIESKSPLLIVVNILDNTLSFIDEETRIEVAKWKIPYTFTGAALLPDQKTILLYGKNIESIYLYDLTTGVLVEEWKTGRGIVNVYISNDQRKLYLANQESDTIQVRAIDGKKMVDVKVGADPLTILESEQLEQLYVINFHDPVISVIDRNTYEKVNKIVAKPAAVGAVLIEQSRELWTGGHGPGAKAENAVTVYSLETGEIKREIEAPIMPVDLEKLGDYVYVVSHGSSQLRKIDMKSKEVVSVIETGANPFEISIMNNLIYSASYDSNEIIVVDPVEMKIIDKMITGKGPFQILYKRGVKND